MNHDQALLQAVCENPDDDVPRLVYADYLEEHGEPERAEFIRLQCALPGLSVADDRYWVLSAREAQLLWRHGKGWAGPLRRLVKRWQYRRGFVEGITLPAADFLRHAEVIFRLEPVRHVRLLAAQHSIADLAGSPHLGHLAGLDLRHHPGLHSERLWRLLGSRHLTGLRSLNLHGTGMCCNLGLAVLARCPTLANLTALDLSDHRGFRGGGAAWYERRTDSGINAAGMRALVESPHLANLRSLALAGYGSGLHQEAMECVLASQFLARLTELDFRGKFTGWRTLLHDLARSPNAAGLRRLRLVNASENRWVETPYRSREPVGPHLANLSTLELEGEYFAETSAEDFAQMPWPQLTTLRIVRSVFHNEYYSDRVRHPLRTLIDASMPRLAVLDLSEAWTNVAQVRALFEAPLLGQLRSLSLVGDGPKPTEQGWQIANQGVESLAASPQAAHLAYLDLGYQNIDDAGATALARSPHLSRLTTLNLWRNNVGAEGAAALARSENLPALSRLDLTANPVPPAAQRLLRQRFSYGARYGPGRELRGRSADEEYEEYDDPATDNEIPF